MNTTLKHFCIILIFIFTLLSLTSFASADGILLYYNSTSSHWYLQNISRELAVINYENGFENMILAVDPSNLSGQRAVWIFPIPADPSGVVIHNQLGFPSFGWQSITDTAKYKFLCVMNLIKLSQIYALPSTYETFYYFCHGFHCSSPQCISLSVDLDGHNNMTNLGLQVEVVSTKDENAFYAYLTSKNLSLPENIKPFLNPYFDKDYSFVIAYVPNVSKFKQDNVISLLRKEKIYPFGISITFPTNKIYFPLRLTAVYGSEKIPINLYIIGQVTPEIYQGIKEYSFITYSTKNSYHVPDKLLYFLNGKHIRSFGFSTIISINAPSNTFNEDLWIENSAPFRIHIDDLITYYPFFWMILLFLLLSCTSSLLAGWIAFRRDSPSKLKLFLFGLWNFLTLIGFIIASLFFRFETQESDSNKKKRSTKVYWTLKKTIFVVLFSLFFSILVFAFEALLHFVLKY